MKELISYFRLSSSKAFWHSPRLKPRGFLHTVSSMLGGTYVSAFIPSLLMSYMQGLCHQPVNDFFMKKPYI
jgi:hypothetical protein